MSRTEKMSRRDFLKSSALLAVGFSLPLKTSILTAATQTEGQSAVEIFPGVTAETHPFNYTDITSEISEPDRHAAFTFTERFRTNYKAFWSGQNNEPPHTLLTQFDNSKQAFFGQIQTPGDLTCVYYSQETGKVVKGFLSKEDADLLGWSKIMPYNGWYAPEGFVPRSMVGISRFGNVAYQVSRDDFGSPKEDALIVADVPNKTKTIIRFKDQPLSMDYAISDNGNALVLMNQINGQVNILNLPQLSLKKQLSFTPSFGRGGGYARFDVKDDATKLFDRQTGEITDVATGEKSKVNFPISFSYGYGVYTASPDFKRFATMVGMFSSGEFTPGQWGTGIDYLNKTNIISSQKRIANFEPMVIRNDGTVEIEDGESSFLHYLLIPDKDGNYKTVYDLITGTEKPLSDY